MVAMKASHATWLSALAVGLFTACASTPQYTGELRTALESSGDNRAELERALQHYGSDQPQKRKAMEFLLENMPGHGFVELRFFDKAKNEVAFEALDFGSLGEAQEAFSKLEFEHGEMNYGRKSFVPDLEVITADYLIDNVERAFAAWHGKPWAQEMNFETFCQHILPYRGSNEPLDDWRGGVMEHFADLESELENPKDASAAARKIEKQAHAWVGFWDLYYLHPTDQSYSEMLEAGKGRCEDITNMISYGLRANAVAVGSDYTPAWANRDNNHAWTTVLGPDGRGATPQGNIAAKIYRKTFALQRDAWMHRAAEGEPVPRWLARDHFIDVTDQYMEVVDAEVNLTATPPEGHKLAYLCVFNGGEWIAIAAGEIDGDSVTFEGMGPGIVYLPAFYDGKDLIPAAAPFTLELDRMKVLNGTGLPGETAVTQAVITTTKPEADDPDKQQAIPELLVKEGETYELFYWDHSWQNLGQRTATGQNLAFENLPGHRLYWLVRTDSRKLERPFTLEPGLRHW